MKWLERHIDNGDKNKRSGGFIHEFITENFYTYRMNICNVYFNSILDLSVFDNTTHVDPSRRNIDISVEENITIAPIADADISTANTKSPIQSPIEDETANKKGIPILNGINLDLSEEVEFEMLEQEVELQDVQQLDTAQGVLGIMTTRPLGLPEAFRGSAPDVPAGIQTLRAVSNNPRVVDLCCKFCRPTTWDNITNNISKMDPSLLIREKDSKRRYLQCRRCGEFFDDLCVKEFLRFFKEKSIDIPWIAHAELFLESEENIVQIEPYISPCCQFRVLDKGDKIRKIKLSNTKRKKQQ